MKTGKNPKKKIEAFAGFAANGSILFATIKATREDAQATLERFNPRLEGVGYGFQVMPVSIEIAAGHQYELETAIQQENATEAHTRALLFSGELRAIKPAKAPPRS
jgi:hypothetical protein